MYTPRLHPHHQYGGAEIRLPLPRPGLLLEWIGALLPAAERAGSPARDPSAAPGADDRDPAALKGRGAARCAPSDRLLRRHVQQVVTVHRLPITVGASRHYGE